MLADQVDYVVGVDTHRDEHVLAVVVASTGAVVAQRSVAATARGYGQAYRFAAEHAGGRRVWAVEGAGHYGAGLARHLSGRGERVLEAGRAPRNERRLHGKDDGLDAIRRTIEALPDSAPYAEWGKWLIADPAKRSIAPGFTITPAEAAKLAAE